jgi:hypothetical protein
MKGRQIAYSADELAFIQSVSTWPRAEAHAAFCQRFRRDDVTLPNFHALCKRKGWMTGRKGRFEKGAVPYNKGVPCGEGKGGRHPNARRTQFKKGNRTGRANLNYQPIGTERITEDGYRERKIHDGLPMQSRWQLVQRIEWEAAHGPIPQGYALKCLDGDKLNTDPSNWEAIPRAVLARLNGGRHKKRLAYDQAEPEVKPLVMAIAKIEHAADQLRKRGEA